MFNVFESSLTRVLYQLLLSNLACSFASSRPRGAHGWIIPCRTRAFYRLSGCRQLASSSFVRLLNFSWYINVVSHALKFVFASHFLMGIIAFA
jgi:hypothetical protein